MCEIRCNNKDCAICRNITVVERYTLADFMKAMHRAKIHSKLKVRILKALRKE